MWTDDIPAGKGWTILWQGRILCTCGGIRSAETQCPACDQSSYDCTPQQIIRSDGRVIEVAQAFMGAEGRYEDYLYLRMMEREWMRTTIQPDFHLPTGVSDKASIVLLYWTYFETRIERLLRVGLKTTPPSLAEDTLSRYTSIGGRLEKLYRVLFGTTYEKDLCEIGLPSLWAHLKEVQKRRNEFMHGNPQSIDDSFVSIVVDRLKEEHDAWTAVFNKRIRADRALRAVVSSASISDRVTI